MAAAIGKGDGETLRRLVKANPALLHQPCGGQKASSPLFAAVMQGKPGMVRVLLEEGANPCETNTEGTPVLTIACERNNAEIARILLEHGADPDQGRMRQESEPHKPINHTLGNPALVKLLVDRGATVTAWDLYSVLNLNRKTREGADYIMEKCGDRFDINTPCIFGKMSILAMMTQCREAEIVEWLLEHGANPNERVADGTAGNALRESTAPALFAARCCRSGSADSKDLRILESFLKHGAAPDSATRTNGVNMPVLAACISADLFDRALLLLRYGAKADVADAAGRPLPYTLTERSALPANAGRQDKILQVADALLKNGASTAQAAPGLPPLKQWAAETANGKPRASREFRAWLEGK